MTDTVFIVARQSSAAHGAGHAPRDACGGALPAFGPFHLLFARLTGSVVLSWPMLRLRAPSVRFGHDDGMTRRLRAAWMAWALAATGAPPLWAFVVPESACCLGRWLPVRQGSGSRTPRAAFTSAAPMRSRRGG